MTTRLHIDEIAADHLLGKFCDRSHYNTLIRENIEVVGTNGIVFKLCKAAFTESEQRQAYAALRPAVKNSNNRGHAAGPIQGQLSGRDWVTPEQIDILLRLLECDVVPSAQQMDESQAPVWLRSKVVADLGTYEDWFPRWYREVMFLPPRERKKAAAHVVSYISNTTYSVQVESGAAGYLDRSPRAPFGRATSFTARHPHKFAECFPFQRRMNAIYKKELPETWQAQRASAARIDPRFLIAGTVFTTLTVNHNWRTAAHRDEGNLVLGLSCLAALTGPDGKGWRGGEFILPEYRVAIDLEPGDLLFVRSHKNIHANGPLRGDHEENDRLTVLAYFREKMLELRSREYERARQHFFTQENYFAEMWRSQKWADYLVQHRMVDEDGLVGND